jgi:LacI family transcriptional regulator
MTSPPKGRHGALTNRGASEQSSTLQDVARLAGVSASTVSRILNGQVDSPRREAVDAAIKKLRFKPNLVAKSLRSGVSMAIGVLTQDFDNPYTSRAAKGVEDELMSGGYTPIVISGHWNRTGDETERVRVLMSRKIDGIVVIGGRLSNEQLLDLSELQPIVAIGRECHGPRLRSLDIDQRQGGYMATRHLIELGHRRIAHIAGIEYQPDAIARMQGYMDAHRDAGLSVDQRLIVHGDFSEPGGVQAMQALLGSGIGFTAVFAANDQSLNGARLVLFNRGIEVPAEISLVGFDGLPASEYSVPPTTTVRQPIYEMGCTAARELLRLLGVQKLNQAPIGSLDLQLMVRGTTAPPPGSAE